MKRICIFILLSSFLVLILISCNKEEGIGGTSSITGKIIERRYNANFSVLSEPQFYSPDEDVFIVFGDDAVYGDKVTTHFDGTYRFDYLREGSYTIFAYSEDSANYPTQRKIPVMKKVEITEKNQTIQVDPIIILK
jgi:hypothetical protein